MDITLKDWVALIAWITTIAVLVFNNVRGRSKLDQKLEDRLDGQNEQIRDLKDGISKLFSILESKRFVSFMDCKDTRKDCGPNKEATLRVSSLEESVKTLCSKMDERDKRYSRSFNALENKYVHLLEKVTLLLGQVQGHLDATNDTFQYLRSKNFASLLERKKKEGE